MNRHRPIHPAVLAGLMPPELPPILSLEEFLETVEPEPPQLVQGILHQTCKMILAGTSKTNKSWCLIDLALSVASGQPWWGRPTTRGPVLYLNFELTPWSFTRRVRAIVSARPRAGEGRREHTDQGGGNQPASGYPLGSLLALQKRLRLP